MQIETKKQQVPYDPNAMPQTITQLALIILTTNKSEIIS
jgi:hypothetical protein